jgi:hypothetical protein
MPFRFLNMAVLVIALSIASVAQARSISFDVVNHTGYTLTAIYTGPSSFDDWGQNILDRPARHGESVTITIDLHDPRECRYDFRYEFSDGDAYEEYAINICDIHGEQYIIE